MDLAGFSFYMWSIRGPSTTNEVTETLILETGISLNLVTLEVGFSG